MGPAQDIYTQLRDRYNQISSLPPTEFENESFAQPGLDGNPAVIWARFTVVTGQEMQMDIGSVLKTFRTRGQLIIQLFAPPNTGTIPIRQLADTLAGSYRNWRGTSVVCEEASIRPVGTEKTSWYQMNVLVSFKSDSLH